MKRKKKKEEEDLSNKILTRGFVGGSLGFIAGAPLGPGGSFAGGTVGFAYGVASAHKKKKKR